MPSSMRSRRVHDDQMMFWWCFAWCAISIMSESVFGINLHEVSVMFLSWSVLFTWCAHEVPFIMMTQWCFDVVLKVVWCSHDVDSELSEVCPLKFVCLFPWCMVFDEVSVKFRLDTDKHHLIKCEHHPKPHAFTSQNSSSKPKLHI